MKARTFVEMKIVGIALDPNNTPIVILRDLENKMVLPIWIGINEASAIAASLEDVTFSRPMTHDLLNTVIERLGGKVTKIEIEDLKDNVFYALITIKSENHKHTISIDARPSDAIALVLRAKAKVFVSRHVLDQASQTSPIQVSGESELIFNFNYEKDKDKLKEILEKMNPEDFGKFKA
jgi:bifunctional DNase/RNase